MSEPSSQARSLDDAHTWKRSSLDLVQHSSLSNTTPSLASSHEWHRNPVFAPPASLLNSRRSSLVQPDLERCGKRRGRRVEVAEQVATEPTSPEDGTNFRRSLEIDMKGLVGDAVGNVCRLLLPYETGLTYFQMSISPSSRDIVLAASVSENSKFQVGSLTFRSIAVEGFLS